MIYTWYKAIIFIALMSLYQTCVAFSPTLSLTTYVISSHSHSSNNVMQHRMISSGFTFTDDDDDQILVSLQKPMGIVLEQDEEGPITVAQVDKGGSAARSGVMMGDILLAVQNASVEKADLSEVLTFIGNAPRVINLRFLRR